MKMKEKLLNDNRFQFDKDNIGLIIDDVIGYEFIDLEIGKIKRYLHEKVFPLSETDVFKYIDNEGSPFYKEQYLKYCSENCYSFEKRGISEFNSLINDISDNDYDPKKGVIVVDQYNIIVDGQHRSCILLKKYGPDYKVKVLKIKYRQKSIKKKFLNFIYDFKQVTKIFK